MASGCPYFAHVKFTCCTVICLTIIFFCGFLMCLAPFSVRNCLLDLCYILVSSFSPPAVERCPFAQEDAAGGSAPIPPQECQRPGAACSEVGLPLQLCLPGAGVAIRLKEDGFTAGAITPCHDLFQLWLPKASVHFCYHHLGDAAHLASQLKSRYI